MTFDSVASPRTTRLSIRYSSPLIAPEKPTRHRSGSATGARTLSILRGDAPGRVVPAYDAIPPELLSRTRARGYRDLYVQSTHLRTRLRDVETVVKTITEGEQPTQSLDELVDGIGLDVSDLHCSIQSSEDLQATFDDFVRGTDLIEDGLLMLSNRSPDELEPGHVETVQSMQEFFFYYVWRYPCLYISRETATGPRRSRCDLTERTDWPTSRTNCKRRPTGSSENSHRPD